MSKQKKIVVTVAGSILSVMCVLFIIVGYRYIQEKQRLAQEPYFTEYKLTKDELEILALDWWVEVTPHWMIVPNEEDWPDFSYYTIEATEETEMVVAIMNYDLFLSDNANVEILEELEEQYNINAQNPITVDWVMTHPQKAVEYLGGRNLMFYDELLIEYTWRMDDLQEIKMQ